MLNECLVCLLSNEAQAAWLYSFPCYSQFREIYMNCTIKVWLNYKWVLHTSMSRHKTGIVLFFFFAMPTGQHVQCRPSPHHTTLSKLYLTNSLFVWLYCRDNQESVNKTSGLSVQRLHSAITRQPNPRGIPFWKQTQARITSHWTPHNNKTFRCGDE